MRNPQVAALEADKLLLKKRRAKVATGKGKVQRAERISVEGRITK